MIKAVKRLWRLATCSHRNAMYYVVPLPDMEVPGEIAELHFCRNCGRLLMACRHSDQPQHNQNWLVTDRLDDEPRLSLPHDPKLRALATR